MYRYLQNLKRTPPAFIQAFLLIILFIILDYEYRTFIIQEFSHMHFSYAFSLPHLVVSICIFLTSLASIILMKPSPYMHATSILFMVFLLIPNLILFQYVQTHPVIPVASLTFILLLRINIPFKGIISWIPQLPAFYLPMILVTLAILLLVPIVIQFGWIQQGDLSLTDTASQYEVRAVVKDELSFFSAYSFGQLAKAILPVMLLFGIAAKRYLFSIAALTGTIYLFMVNPHKTFIIAILPLLFFSLFRDMNKKATYFLMLMILLIAASKLSSAWISILPESLIVRRSLFTQPLLTQVYFDFFRGHPVFLSHSFLEHWFHYPYPLTPPYLIGNSLFGNPEMSCNTGFIGDGYMNFGYTGTFIYLTISAGIFHLISNLNLKPVYFGLTFLVIFYMLNSALFTLFLTHGLFILLLIMIFLLRNKGQSPEIPSVT